MSSNGSKKVIQSNFSQTMGAKEKNLRYRQFFSGGLFCKFLRVQGSGYGDEALSRQGLEAVEICTFFFYKHIVFLAYFDLKFSFKTIFWITENHPVRFSIESDQTTSWYLPFPA